VEEESSTVASLYEVYVSCHITRYAQGPCWNSIAVQQSGLLRWMCEDVQFGLVE
jgi:hypothetical protein